MKETKGVAPVAIAVVIIVAIIAAVGVWYVTRVEEEEEPGIIPREQSFIYGMNIEGPEPSFNPITAIRVSGDFEVPPIYEPLAFANAQTGEFNLILAKSWHWVNDYTLEIKIRPEAHFRKGQPVTADDVAFSLETLGDPTISGLITSYMDMVESTEVLDEKTLHLHIKTELPPRNNKILGILLPPTRIFQKERWSELLDEYGENIMDYKNTDPEEMNGSGSYTLVSNTPETTVYVRVEDYWGNQLGWYYAPKYYKALWLGAGDKCLLAIERGDIDATEIVGVTNEWYEEHKDTLWSLDRNAPLEQRMPMAYVNLIAVPNVEKEIFRYEWLREAMAYAIDYDRIVDAWGPVSRPANLYYLPDGLPWDEVYNSDIVTEYFETEGTGIFNHIKYDPEKAVEILSEHCEGSVEEGWTYNGEEIGPFTILAWSGPVNVMAACTVFATSLTDIGIETTPDFPAYNVFDEKCRNWDFDIRWAVDRFEGAPNAVAGSFRSIFVDSPETWFGSQCDYQRFWTGNYPPLENTADEVKALIDELYTLEPGTEEFFEATREIQEIVIPQMPVISLFGTSPPQIPITSYWVNHPYNDDPLDFSYTLYQSGEWWYGCRHYYPSCVDTVGATLSDSTVGAGESVTVEVTLKNNGAYKQLYPVHVHEGPAEPGLHDEDIIAHGAITIEPGKTVTVEIEVAFDTPGTYTLTVDDWRYSEWDPGDPIELTLTVE